MNDHGGVHHQKGRLNNQGILRQNDLHVQDDCDFPLPNHDLHGYDERDCVLILSDFQLGDYPHNVAQNYE